MSHFFKVLLSKTLRDGKLKIPLRFVKRLAPSLSLSELIVLEDPKGEKWEVKLKKIDNGEEVNWYLYGQGWSDFADYYSLQRGHLIVFNYIANSHFHVVIFDDTATEIHYPSSTNNILPTTTHTYDDDDDDSVQVLDTPPPVSHKAAGKRTSNPTHHHHIIGSSASKAAKKLKTRAVERAEANFEFENPFFSLVLKPTYVDGGRYMNLPKDFVEQYLKDDDVEVVLGSSDGRTWPVRYLYQTIRQKPNGKFTSGWAKFALDNDLKVGDLCVFELIKKPKHFHFQVWVFL